MTYAGTTEYLKNLRTSRIVLLSQNEKLQTCLVVRSRTTQWGNLPPRPWWRFSLLRLNRWSVIAFFSRSFLSLSFFVIIFFCHCVFLSLSFFYHYIFVIIFFVIIFFCHYIFSLCIDFVDCWGLLDFDCLCSTGAKEVGREKLFRGLSLHRWHDHVRQACRVGCSMITYDCLKMLTFHLYLSKLLH